MILTRDHESHTVRSFADMAAAADFYRERQIEPSVALETVSGRYVTVKLWEAAGMIQMEVNAE